MKIAILGGSFDPPHVAHLMVANYVLVTRKIDRVWLMPCFRHPFDKPHSDFTHRVKMCRLACRPFSPRIQTSKVEGDLGGASHTVDTLEHLHRKHPNHSFSLIIGTDILKEAGAWKDFDRIQELAHLIVVDRGGESGEDVVLKNADRDSIRFPEISSTEIRRRVRQGLPIEHLVPRPVADYLLKQGLYK